MAEVALLHHHGRLAAVPVRRVLGVTRRLPEGARTLELWPGDPSLDVQWARCTNDGGTPCHIACAWAKVVGLPRERVWPLSTLLKRALPSRRVVGMAESSEGTAWLIDLSFDD